MDSNIDIAELKRLHAAAPLATWKVGKNKSGGRVQVYNGQHQVCAVWHTTAHPAASTAEAIAALHNAFPALIARLEAAEAAMQWRSIEEAYAAYLDGSLRECETILVQHRDDLYPTAAYLLDKNDRSSWYRTVEGPEDIARSGANEPLYHAPTHYMLLPAPPEAAR